jgi:hypothetical protein
LFGLKFGIEADFFATTEQRYRVQNLNRLGINPRWKWGQAHLGDFVPRWTRLTLSGMQTRGGGIEINPGLFRFSVLGGQVFKASRKVRREAYKRTQFGVSVGIGRNRGNFLDFKLLSTRDDPDSFTPDTTARAPVTPQENVVIATHGRLSLFDKKLRLEGEFAGCAHSQDINASEFENDYVNSSVLGLFTPRLSSRIDYAYSLKSSIRLSAVNLNADIDYIGPGYTSLGVAYLLNDRTGLSFGGNTRLLDSKVILRANYRTQHDNLLGQKRYTTTRNRTNAGVIWRPMAQLMLNASTNFNTISNDTDNDTLKIDTNIDGYMLMGNYSFLLTDLNTNLIASYSHQTSSNENDLRQINDVVVQSANLRYSVDFDINFTGNCHINYSDSDVRDLTRSIIRGFGVGATYYAFTRRLSTNLNVTLNNSQTGRTLGLVLSTNFKITPRDNFSLSFRNTGYTPDEEDIREEEETTSIIPKKYNETIFIVRLTRKF